MIILPSIIAASRRRSSYLVSEDFEGTGMPSGWTGAGSPDFDYATAPAPLVGLQSLYCATGGDGGYATFSAQSEVWAFCRMVRTALPSALNQSCFSLRNSAGGLLASLRGRSTTNNWRFYVGSTLIGFAVTGSENADVSVWIRYKKGSGANAEGDLYMAVGSEIRPALTASTTTGTATADASRVYCLGNSGSPHIFDKVRVSASPIGSTPA